DAHSGRHGRGGARGSSPAAAAALEHAPGRGHELATLSARPRGTGTRVFGLHVSVLSRGRRRTRRVCRHGARHGQGRARRHSDGAPPGGRPGDSRRRAGYGSAAAQGTGHAVARECVVADVPRRLRRAVRRAVPRAGPSARADRRHHAGPGRGGRARVLRARAAHRAEFGPGTSLITLQSQHPRSTFSSRTMKIGVPKEIKTNENRIALVPAGAEALVAAGHTVAIETGAGLGSGFTDEAYTSVGATIAPDAATTWRDNDMIMKVKEPIASEWKHMRRGQLIFTYFHFAADEKLTKAHLESGA